jgi:hypothetical protein
VYIEALRKRKLRIMIAPKRQETGYYAKKHDDFLNNLSLQQIVR